MATDEELIFNETPDGAEIVLDDDSEDIPPTPAATPPAAEQYSDEQAINVARGILISKGYQVMEPGTEPAAPAPTATALKIDTSDLNPYDDDYHEKLIARSAEVALQQMQQAAPPQVTAQKANPTLDAVARAELVKAMVAAEPKLKGLEASIGDLPDLRGLSMDACNDIMNNQVTLRNLISYTYGAVQLSAPEPLPAPVGTAAGGVGGKIGGRIQVSAEDAEDIRIGIELNKDVDGFDAKRYAARYARDNARRK